MERYDLRDGWEWKKIGEVANTTSGGTPSRTRPEFYNGSIPWLKSGELEDNYISDTGEKISESGLKSSSAKIFPKGTALVALYGATVGKTGILEIDSATNQAVCALFPRDNAFTAEFITYWLRSQRQSLIDLSIGGAQPNISQGIIRDFDIPLPSLPEQQRIVAKIGSLFEQSRAARTALTRVPVLMSQFRRAVLDSATSGRLTEEWREEREIKEQWKETDVQSVASVGTGSTPLRTNKSFYSEKGTPWITSAATGKPFITNAQEYVTEPAIKAHRLKLYPVGTLLVAMYGEGKTRGQVSELAIEATINQACAAIIVDEGKIEKSYLKLVLKANYLEIRELAEGGSQPNLNLTKIKEFSFLLPSLDEQKEIVRRIEALFAQADIIEQAASVSLRRAEQVDQSILARAFRGELG